MDHHKVAAIREWACPTNCTEVRRFVGLANHYRRFVRQFSLLAAPLTGLCSPLATFCWTNTEQQSFEALQAALMSAPVLRVWDPGLPTRLTTDASELMVSGILEQPDSSGAFHPIAYESRKTHRPGARIPTSPVGAAGGGPLPQVFSLVPLGPFMAFELRTDNASLQWFLQQRLLNRHQARWSHYFGVPVLSCAYPRSTEPR